MSILVIATGACLGVLAALGIVYAIGVINEKLENKK